MSLAGPYGYAGGGRWIDQVAPWVKRFRETKKFPKTCCNRVGSRYIRRSVSTKVEGQHIRGADN